MLNESQETIKIVRFYGVNNEESYPEDTIKEIIENHPKNKDISGGWLTLSEEEIKKQIEKNIDIVKEAIRKKNRPRKWVLNGDYLDPTNLDFNILSLSSKEIRDEKTNELIAIEHYKDFNLESYEFSNLAVKENFKNHLDKETETKIIAQEVEITWYKEKFEDEKEDFIGCQKIFINTLDIRL